MANLAVKGSTIETGSGMNDFPLDIVFDILLKLPLEFLIDCKRVCKTWYGIIKDPQFIELLLNRSICEGHRRCVLSYGSDGIFSIYSLVKEMETKWRPIKEALPDEMVSVSETVVGASCNGLLCLSPNGASSYPVFIINTITRECVKIPGSTEPVIVRNPVTRKEQDLGTLQPMDYEQDIGFGYDPISKYYKVLKTYFVYIDEQICSAGEILTMGESSWRRLEFPHFIISDVLQTFFMDGSFYWKIDNTKDLFCIDNIMNFSCIDNILAFNIHDEKFCTFEFPIAKEKELWSGDFSLMDLGGMLSVGYNTGYDTGDDNITIWQMDDNKWTCQYEIIITGNLLYGVGINGNILLEVTTSYDLVEEERLGVNVSKLVFYDTTKRQAYEIEILGNPLMDQINHIVPSLVSPKAVLSGF